MAKKDILDQIAALQAEADAMGDEDEDFEIEFWNEKGEGARLPHKQAQPWLASKFPELFPVSDDTETDDSAKDDPKAKTKTPPAKSRTTTGQPVASRYFGKRPAGK